MTSFIISTTGELIAKAPREMKSGEQVRFSYEKVSEALNANREYNLVNARTGKISNAKKWEKIYQFSDKGTATEINTAEFLI